MSEAFEVAGMSLLVVFAGTFGARWAYLAAAVCLLIVGLALDGTKIAWPKWHWPKLRWPWHRDKEPAYGVVKVADL
jgi:hypothetical protein